MSVVKKVEVLTLNISVEDALMEEVRFLVFISLKEASLLHLCYLVLLFLVS